MSYLWLDEAIQVEVDVDGRPLRFLWRGQRYRIQTIMRRWQEHTDWWSEEGRIWRDYWRVDTSEGVLLVIYQDLLTKNWRLEKIYD
jgi:hypothetical protein